MEPKRPADPESADRYEAQALNAIESVQDPEVAMRLLENVRLADEAVRLKKLGEDRERRWHALVLRAERKYGQLLGEPALGPPKGNANATRNNVSATNVVSKAERFARSQARNVAAVPDVTFEDYVNGHRNPTRAGLLRHHNQIVPPEASRRPRQRTENGNNLWEDERVLAWYAKRMKIGRTREEIVEESKNGTHGWPLPGAHLPTNAASRVRAILKDRERRPEPEKVNGRPSRNWDGKSNAKRQRELRAGRSEDNYAELLELQMRISRMCVILEDWQVIEDCQLDEVSLLRISDIHDDLLSLGEWYDRTLSAVQGRLSDAAVLQKIAKLRDTSGRTPDEAQTALRLAERLERKLESRLSS